MDPNEAMRILAKAEQEALSSKILKPLMAINVQDAVHALLFSEMQKEGMDVQLIDGDIELCNVQDRYDYIYDRQSEPFSLADLNGSSKRFRNMAHKLFHLRMVAINYNPAEYDNLQR